MKWFRLTLFILSFSMEIHVRAESILALPVAPHPIQLPENCIDSDGPCTVQTEAGEKVRLKYDQSTLHMAPKTVVTRIAPGKFRILRGAIWVQAVDPVEIESAYGSFKTEEGDFWVIKKGSRVFCRVVDQTVEALPRGGKNPLTIHRGFENWLGAVGSRGVADSGLPTVIDFHEHLREWALLFPGSKHQFKKAVSIFLLNWQQATLKGSQFYKEVSEREIASYKARQLRAQERRRRREAENRALRKLFHKKTFGSL